MMQEGIQDNQGQFYLKRPSPLVGKIVTFDCNDQPCEEKQVVLACLQEDVNEWYCHPAAVGSDLYACASAACSISWCLQVGASILFHWSSCSV
jgi:hypothetical protein